MAKRHTAKIQNMRRALTPKNRASLSERLAFEADALVLLSYLPGDFGNPKFNIQPIARHNAKYEV